MSVSVDDEPSARTVSAGLASWVTESRAIGALSGGGFTVMLLVTGAEVRLPPSVAVSVTV